MRCCCCYCCSCHRVLLYLDSALVISVTYGRAVIPYESKSRKYGYARDLNAQLEDLHRSALSNGLWESIPPIDGMMFVGNQSRNSDMKYSHLFALNVRER